MLRSSLLCRGHAGRLCTRPALRHGVRQGFKPSSFRRGSIGWSPVHGKDHALLVALLGQLKEFNQLFRFFPQRLSQTHLASLVNSSKNFKEKNYHGSYTNSSNKTESRTPPSSLMRPATLAKGRQERQVPGLLLLCTRVETPELSTIGSTLKICFFRSDTSHPLKFSPWMQQVKHQ